MAAQKKYPDELRERAVKMVLEIREREGKGHGELVRVARQLGVHPEAPPRGPADFPAHRMRLAATPASGSASSVMRPRAAVDRYDALTARAGVENGLEPWQTTTTGRPGRRHLGAERTRPKSPHPYICPLCPIRAFLVSDLDVGSHHGCRFRCC